MGDEHATPVIGVVVIGRNEGTRLEACLRSIGPGHSVVYVDSGSSDGSPERACELGASVVALDLSKPFTASRARNAGFQTLMQTTPSAKFVQFVDGDCELREGWIKAGAAALESQPDLAVVCGRLRERHPEHSVYNRMCDMGWDYPIGDISSCGGVAMYRSSSFSQAGGFNEMLVAGEEFEICHRLRSKGFRVCRIDAEMAWHDVGMTRFSQWWNRTKRAGFAFGEAWLIYPASVGGRYRRSVLRSLFWGIGLPATVLLGAFGAILWRPLAILPLAAILLAVLQIARLAFAHWRRGAAARYAIGFAAMLFFAKFPEAHGVLKCWSERLAGKRPRIIEYR
jgi:glycosyltransferase involved in cell wall biosynthesis